MALRLASEGRGTARIAVVGAESLSGTQLRAALADFGVAGSRVNLYAAAGGEAVISEYAGEARLIQDPDLPEIVAHDFIYLCESGALADQVIAAAGVSNTVVDLIGCLPAHVDSRLIHPGFTPPVPTEQAGYVTFPHALSITLAELLHGVEQAQGVERGVCTVLQPASAFGQPGLEELREQTVRLLNFAEVPRETFGAQLTFNTLCSAGSPSSSGPNPSAADARPVDERVREETMRLFGWDRPRLTLSLLTVPVFHGYGLQLNLSTRSSCTLADLRQTLASSPFFGPPLESSAVTPLRVASESVTVVAEPAEDGLGGFWIWAVAGDVEFRSAKLAVMLSTEGPG